MKNQAIKITENLNGVLSYPSDVDLATTELPALLYLHGFASNKDEVNGFYSNLSAELSSEKYISLRIDFSGFGENSSLMKNSTITSMLNDALTALNYLKKVTPLSGKIGIIGFSLGAAIGMLVSSRFNLDFLVLISPALNLKDDLKTFLGESNFIKLSESSQICKISLPWVELELGADFLNSLSAHVPLQSINKYMNPIFCIVGSNDFTLNNAKQIISSRPSDQGHLEVMDGLDHIFNDANSKSHLNLISNNIRDWLATCILKERNSFRLR